MSDEKFLEAAVLILTYQENNEEYVVLTKRTQEVLHHKGQICFPGGAQDPGDPGPWETALRETQEEIGLDPTLVKLVRELRPHFTPTGFRVTPFLASLPGPFDWQPNPIETAEVFSVPISHLKDPKNLTITTQTWAGKKYQNPNFSYKDHEIWGVTGRILCDVLKISL